jgi:hypothetical protein
MRPRKETRNGEIGGCRSGRWLRRGAWGWGFIADARRYNWHALNVLPNDMLGADDCPAKHI